MAPPLPSSARLRLRYLLYACDFDPLNSGYLLVGGGGGEGLMATKKARITGNNGPQQRLQGH
jgi:hypothetical protein